MSWSSRMDTRTTSTSDRSNVCPAVRPWSCPEASALGAPASVRGRSLRSGQTKPPRLPASPIQAVPARHWISPGAPRAQPVGYVLDHGARVYFAGDTGRYPAMRDVAGGVDLALLPVWTWGPHLGPGHLGPRAAAEVAGDIGAATVVPIHWGTLYPRHLHRVWRRPLLEPGDRFAAYAGQLAPSVDVRVDAARRVDDYRAHISVLRAGSSTRTRASRRPPRGVPRSACSRDSSSADQTLNAPFRRATSALRIDAKLTQPR